MVSYFHVAGLKRAIGISKDVVKKFLPLRLRKYMRQMVGQARRNALRLWAARLTRERIWLFSSWEGYAFSDNSKHLFIHVVTKHPEIKAIWISRDWEIVRYLRSQGFASELSSTARADAYALAAEAFLFSDVAVGFGMEMNPDALLVNLWHGMPMKDIGNLSNTFDLLISTSLETRNLLSRVFGVDPDLVVVSGEPKNDVLFTPAEKPQKIRQWGMDAKVISYMPTYRGEFGGKSLASRANESGIFLDACLFGALRDRFVSLLEKNNAVFVIKPHLRNKMSRVDIPRVVVIDDFATPEDNVDSHQLLSFADLLITDYSSVYFSFLLVDRPYILYTPDLVAYLREQNLYYDVSELSAGHLALDEETLLDQIAFLLTYPNANSLARLALKERFHFYRDNESSERVFSSVCERIPRRRS